MRILALFFVTILLFAVQLRQMCCWYCVTGTQAHQNGREEKEFKDEIGQNGNGRDGAEATNERNGRCECADGKCHKVRE